MAIKINTAYGERLTSGMLNEKISNLVGGNEKLSGFDVAITSPTSVTITPGKAIVNGCAIEETSETRTLTIDQEILSIDGVAYVVLNYVHETKSVIFSCAASVAGTMVKLATLFIKDGVISELTNHTTTKTLSTVVAEATEIEAQKVRDSIPSGFVELGELDYDFMLNNENQVKLKTKSTAYVNGYRVEIPANTVINIGKAPEKESREDLLFLEAWKDSDFNKDGKLKWRIRHIEDMNFSYVGHPDTVSSIHPYVGWWDESNFTKIYAKGANSTLDAPKNIGGQEVFRSSISSWNNRGWTDIGLWIAGNGDSFSEARFKTIDGYVYATPMFRLYRKPSCGKSTPFEYDKINPKVDYSKFAKLVQDERVERVHSENIKGMSLVNLATPRVVSGAGNAEGTIITKITNGYRFQKSNTNSFYPKFIIDKIIKPNTTYTIVYDIKASRSAYLGFCIAYGDSYLNKSNSDGSVLYNQELNTGTQKHVKLAFTTANATDNPNYNQIGVGFANFNQASDWCEITNMIILEGDWTNKEIPKYFEGLKSSGEDNGNLVIIKNGVLNDNTYDPCDGNQKLNTFSNVTHIISENTIIPEFTAEVKNQGVKQSDVTEFGKLVTDGTEQVEFTKIKGRTLQNLSHIKDFACSSSQSHNSSHLLKRNTTYTFFTRITNVSGSPRGSWFRIHFSDGEYLNVVDGSYVDGYKQVVFTTPDKEITSYYFGWFRSYVEGQTATMNDIMVLEGDYTNMPLEKIPYIEGIKSVGDNENNRVVLRVNGKNLFSLDDAMNASSVTQKGYIITSSKRIVKINRRLEKDVKYTLSFKENIISGSLLTKVFYGDATTLTKYVAVQSDASTGRRYCTITPEIENCYISTYIDAGSTASVELSDIQLVEGDDKQYIKTLMRQDIYMKEPLRSLPGGVCDEIIGNKIIRRIGKITLNGSESWIMNDKVANPEKHSKFVMYKHDVKTNTAIISDKFKSIIYTDGSQLNEEYVMGHPTNSEISVSFLKSKLATQDLAGFKTWLSQNPTTVYYELINPIEEYLEHVYEKESIKTYQLDAPLRSLPNGVKDEIKDGVLIRRCGSYNFRSMKSTQFVTTPNLMNDSIINVPVGVGHFPGMKKQTSATCRLMNRFKSTAYPNGYGADSYTIVWATNECYIQLPKSLWSNTPSSSEFAATLNEVGGELIYELDSPVQTILTESKPQDANFTLQRQFNEGNWLRELPNGVKDTIENGKVIRRVGVLNLNGTETFFQHTNANDTTLLFYTQVISSLAKKNGGENGNVFSNKFNQLPGYAVFYEDCVTPSFYLSNSNNLYFRISKASLTSYDLTGFQAWLSKNPVTVLYELATPTEEALSTDNHMPFPCHEINTCCGSMYVGQGRNHIENNNSMPTQDTIVVDTPFRTIENKAVIEDCRYKKCDDGYDTKYIVPAKNLFDIDNYIKCVNKYANCANNAKSPNTLTHVYNGYPNTYCPVYNLKKGATFTISAKDPFIAEITPVDSNNNAIISSNTTSFTFVNTISDTVRIKVRTNSTTGDIRDIQIEQGSMATEYERYIPITKYFENTKSNDIEDLRHQVSLTGFNYDKILNESFDKLLRGEL